MKQKTMKMKMNKRKKKKMKMVILKQNNLQTTMMLQMIMKQVVIYQKHQLKSQPKNRPKKHKQTQLKIK